MRACTSPTRSGPEGSSRNEFYSGRYQSLTFFLSKSPKDFLILQLYLKAQNFCCSVSIAQGRNSRKRSKAPSELQPISRSNRSKNMPDLPHPPIQLKIIPPPLSTVLFNIGIIEFHSFSRSASGI